MIARACTPPANKIERESPLYPRSHFIDQPESSGNAQSHSLRKRGLKAVSFSLTTSSINAGINSGSTYIAYMIISSYDHDQSKYLFLHLRSTDIERLMERLEQLAKMFDHNRSRCRTNGSFHEIKITDASRSVRLKMY